MSIVLLAVGMVLVLAPTDAQIKAIGTGIITSVSATWLVTSSANIVSRQTQKQQDITHDNSTQKQ
jgi:hypothetical protein